jgi:hypothetical protein
VGADDLIIAAAFLDVNQVFSCLVGHLFENVEKVNSLLDQDVDCEIRFTSPHQPLVSFTQIIDQLEPCHFQKFSRFLCLQERHEGFASHDRLHSGHRNEFLARETDVSMRGLDQV